jgi:6-phosphogluconolactonase
MNFVSYPDRELMMFSLADRIASELGVVLRQGGGASLSVPGGTTPGPIFDVLSAAPIAWDRVTIFPNDERWVPEDSERSNALLIRQRLLVGAAAAARYISLHTDDPEPETAVGTLSEALAPHLPISVLLLGMGEDMHTASLFPGGDRLAEALTPAARVVLPMRAPAAGETRVTLSARTLSTALHIHVLITGTAKRAAIERARDLPAEQAPIRAVLGNATVHWAE